jgi:predicted small secreted protein
MIIRIAALIAFICLAGCNTIGGFGKDVSETGKAIDNAAGWTQNKVNKTEQNGGF